MVSDALFRAKTDEILEAIKGPYEEITFLPKDSAADEWGHTIFEKPFDTKITKVEIIPSGDIGQATNNMTLDVVNVGADGTGTTSLMTAARVCNTSNAIAKIVGLALVAASKSIPANARVTLKKTVGGTTGQAFPGARIKVTYEKA